MVFLMETKFINHECFHLRSVFCKPDCSRTCSNCLLGRVGRLFLSQHAGSAVQIRQLSTGKEPGPTKLASPNRPDADLRSPLCGRCPPSRETTQYPSPLMSSVWALPRIYPETLITC